MFNKSWFSKNQSLLLKFANTKYGKKVLGIDTPSRIVNINTHSVTWKGEKKNEFVTKFNSYPEYSRILRKKLYPLWWLAHQWDTLVANKFNPEWNLGFDLLIVQPDVPASTTCAGRVGRIGVNETLAVIRAGAGNLANTGIRPHIRIQASTTSNQYQQILRAIMTFDTSTLTSAATISAASIDIQADTKTNGLSGEASANSVHVLVAATPASNNTLVNGDYSQLGSVDFGRSPTQQNMSTVAANTITLNASGIANISKTGISGFGFRNGWDFDNTATGLTWASAGNQEVVTGLVNSGTGSEEGPTLFVTYTLPSTGGNPIFFSSGGIGLS